MFFRHSSIELSRRFQRSRFSLRGSCLTFFSQRSHLTFQLSHFNAPRMKILIEKPSPSGFDWPKCKCKLNGMKLSDFSKTFNDKLYLLRIRLQSLLLSALAYFGVDKTGWFRLFQLLPFLTICAFIRSFDDFVLRKLSFIARFLTFFSLSRCITCACWFSSVNLLFLIVGGWICCWLLDTHSASVVAVVVCVIKRRLRVCIMFGRPLCAMK